MSIDSMMDASQTTNSDRLIRWAWIAVFASVVTIAIKASAWWLTGSVGLLSDSLESFANLAGATLALILLKVATRPADANHAYGHEKAEYFSSGAEGLLVLGGAIAIASTAIHHLLYPVELTRLSLGMLGAGVAAVINFAVGWKLLDVGKSERSVTLEASGRHLLVDVWTTGGVLVAIALVNLTGWNVLDPIVALLLAGHVAWTGWGLLRRSIGGLMDEALSESERAAVECVLDDFRRQGIDFHAVRTRRAGSRCFVSMHVLVPGDWTVLRGHRLIERVEAAVAAALPGASVFTHLEALEDPASFEDIELR